MISIGNIYIRRERNGGIFQKTKGIGIANLVQTKEREKFLDFPEVLRNRMEQEGHKQGRWKREC